MLDPAQLLGSVNYRTLLLLKDHSLIQLNPRPRSMHHTLTPWCYAQPLASLLALWRMFYPLAKSLLFMALNRLCTHLGVINCDNMY